MQFELPLAEEKVKRRQVITLHLIVGFTLITTGLFLLLLKVYLGSIPESTAATLLRFDISVGWAVLIGLAGAGLLSTVLTKSQWLLKQNVNRNMRLLEIAIVFVLCLFAAFNELPVPATLYGVILAASLFAIYWEGVSDTTLYIQFNDKGIRLPLTSRKKFIEWWEIERVLLKFGIITIDCHDNRLFQWNIKTVNFDKEDFQRFCTEQIAENKEKRKKYEW